jgi:hypothetical protein
MVLRSIACLLALGLAAPGIQGAPMNPDPTGMWYDPAQPGWGMSVTQQGETIFVALFVYDANHAPRWYVASNVVATGQSVNFLVGEAYAGPLYATTGASYTNPADTTTLATTPVGTMQIAYVQPTSNLSVTYTVNGTTVNKVVQPQTWDSNASMLPGIFSGAIHMASTPNCQVPAPLQGITNFTIAAGSTPDQVTINWGSGIDVGCAISGAYSQQGQFGTLSGPVSCGPIPNLIANVGTITVTQMKIAPNGFSGYLNYSPPSSGGSSCGVFGTIGGVKNAPGWVYSPDFTGLWYDPLQAGWGVHLTTQGRTTFAVLFVYDASHSPAWLVSTVMPGGDFPGLGSYYAGSLYRTTGPTYLLPSDGTAFAANSIGNFSFFKNADSDLKLGFNDGMTTVTRTIQPQTWSSDAAELVGTFDGGVFLKGGLQCPLPCPSDGCTPFPPGNQAITISAGAASSSTVNIAWGTGTTNACAMTATYTQIGQSGTLTGPLQCASSGSALATIGTLTLSPMSFGPAGFSGLASLQSPNCTYEGTIGGVKNQ